SLSRLLCESLRVFFLFSVAVVNQAADQRNELACERWFQRLRDDHDTHFTLVGPVTRCNLLNSEICVARSIHADNQPHWKIRFVELSASNSNGAARLVQQPLRNAAKKKAAQCRSPVRADQNQISFELFCF